MTFDTLIASMEARGAQNDIFALDKKDKYLNITRDTGEFLNFLVTMEKPERVLEVGTSNGYSTLWLSKNLPSSGRIITLDINPSRLKEANENFKELNVQSKVSTYQIGVQRYLRDTDAPCFDMVFLDANRDEYLSYFNALLSRMRKGGLLICDNANSHREELEELLVWIERHPGLSHCIVNVGKGELLVYKHY
ncbi:O-methyltransferase [Vibrio sp. HN007]|uniref:O-methyltransferase n=1 Tax=Vibrio iocasae TaxID=3098914 RepID=UPI0035D3FE69